MFFICTILAEPEPANANANEPGSSPDVYVSESRIEKSFPTNKAELELQKRLEEAVAVEATKGKKKSKKRKRSDEELHKMHRLKNCSVVLDRSDCSDLMNRSDEVHVEVQVPVKPRRSQLARKRTKRNTATTCNNNLGFIDEPSTSRLTGSNKLVLRRKATADDRQSPKKRLLSRATGEWTSTLKVMHDGDKPSNDEDEAQIAMDQDIDAPEGTGIAFCYK